MFLHDKITRPVALTIDDPLRPGANIGAGSFNMFHVQVCTKLVNSVVLLYGRVRLFDKLVLFTLLTH